MQDRGRLCVAAVTAVLLAGCAAQTAQPKPWDLYNRSIATAALSDEAHALKPINAEQAEVTVVRVQDHATVTTDRYVWVAGAANGARVEA